MMLREPGRGTLPRAATFWILATLRPRVAVPRPARGTFAVAIPCIVSGWALGGLYLSLGPSLAAQATGSPNLLWGGLVIFLLMNPGDGDPARTHRPGG